MKSRFAWLFPALAAALCVGLAAQLALQDPRYLLPLGLVAALALVPPWLARRRMRRLLMSGDVEQVLGSWRGTLDRLVYPETMAPLMAATAYAAYGWTDQARSSLGRAAKGPAWDAALEQRLFVETLLDTFEGDRQGALVKAEQLAQMPMPVSGPLAQRRVTLLRRGLAALARAFAHQSLARDGELLRRAAAVSPLVHWAMRYAGAVVAIDRGDKDRARALLAGAPDWPRHSAFRAYHDELAAHAA